MIQPAATITNPAAIKAGIESCPDNKPKKPIGNPRNAGIPAALAMTTTPHAANHSRHLVAEGIDSLEDSIALPRRVSEDRFAFEKVSPQAEQIFCLSAFSRPQYSHFFMPATLSPARARP